MSNFDRNNLDDYIQRSLASPKSLKSDRRIIAMDRVTSKLKNNDARNAKIKKTVDDLYADPVYRARRQEIANQVAQSEKYKINHALGMKKREENGWYEKRGKAYKTIQTPYGLFESKKAAVEAMSTAGIINANGKLSVWLKTNPSEYYYV